MQITFDDYAKNPSGGRTRMVGEAETARQLYTKKFDEMMLRVNGKINYTLYKNTNEKYVLYIMMPSEKDENIFYDVVIEFTTNDDVQKRLNKISGYDIKVFSNDPNFMFTYANAFKHNDLLIKELVKKFDPIVFKQHPTTTNPNKIVGYVKSIYFAYLLFKLKGLENKIMWMNAYPYKPQNLASQIMSGKEKLIQVQNIKKLQSSTKYGSNYVSKDDFSDTDSLQGKGKAYATKVKTVKTVQHVNKSVSKRSGNYVKKVSRHY